MISLMLTRVGEWEDADSESSAALLLLCPDTRPKVPGKGSLTCMQHPLPHTEEVGVLFPWILSFPLKKAPISVRIEPVVIRTQKQAHYWVIKINIWSASQLMALVQNQPTNHRISMTDRFFWCNNKLRAINTTQIWNTTSFKLHVPCPKYAIIVIVPQQWGPKGG